MVFDCASKKLHIATNSLWEGASRRIRLYTVQLAEKRSRIQHSKIMLELFYGVISITLRFSY